jgi:hypothetical protein
MEDDESLENHLKRCQHTGGFTRLTERNERSELTIEFGSRKRGERALQTSWMAPSSDHVAAMMGSMYFLKLGMDTNGDKDKWGRAYLCFWRSRFWFASVLDDLFE